MAARPFVGRFGRDWASVIAGALFLFFLAFSACGAYIAHRSLRAKASERFEMRADRIAMAIEMSLDGYTRALLGVNALFEAHPAVRRSEFQAFIGAYDISKGSPGIFALGYVERVPPWAAAGVVRSMRAEGFADFAIVPKKEDAYVAKYVFVNEQAAYPPPSGYDFLSDPARRAAIEAARDSGRRAATAPVILRGGAGERRGFIVFAPLYAPGKPAGTLEERRAHIRGVSSIAFKSDVFFPNALRLAPIPDEMRVYVEDSGVNLVGGADLYLHDARVDFETAFRTERIVDAAGRTWRVSFAAPQDFGMSRLDRLLPLIFFLRGLALAVLVPSLAYLLLQWRAKVRAAKIGDVS